MTRNWISERGVPVGKISISLKLNDSEMNTRAGYARGKISICLPLNDTEMKSKASNARGNLNLSTAESHRDGFPNNWIKNRDEFQSGLYLRESQSLYDLVTLRWTPE